MVNTVFINILVAESCHPGTCTFSSTRVEVSVNNTYEVTVIVSHFKSFHVRVINFDVRVISKVNAVKSCSESENAFDNVVKFKVRAHFFFVVSVFGIFEFIAVIAVVPRIDSYAMTFNF